MVLHVFVVGPFEMEDERGKSWESLRFVAVRVISNVYPIRAEVEKGTFGEKLRVSTTCHVPTKSARF